MRQHITIRLHLVWTDSTSDDPAVNAANRLEFFEAVRNKGLDQSKARILTIAECTWHTITAAPATVFGIVTHEAKQVIMQEFVSTSDQAPAKPVLAVPVREQRVRLPNGALHTYWAPQLCEQSLRQLSRGGFFGRSDECILSHVHGKQQLFVTSEYVLVSALSTNKVLWEVACSDIVNVNNCWGEALQILVEDTPSVLTMKDVKSIDEVLMHALENVSDSQINLDLNLNLFVCDDVVQLEGLHNLINHIKSSFS